MVGEPVSTGLAAAYFAASLFFAAWTSRQLSALRTDLLDQRHEMARWADAHLLSSFLEGDVKEQDFSTGKSDDP